MTGNSSTTFDGIMFAPNAELDLSGNTSANALGSQMFVNNAKLVGNSTLAMAPHDDRLQALGGANARLIRIAVWRPTVAIRSIHPGRSLFL